MPTLTVTVGLPGCGKSYWAKNEIAKARSKTVNINRDDIRASMVGGDIESYKYKKDNERYITDQQLNMALDSVQRNWNIIISDTNLNPTVFEMWKNFAKEHKYTFKVQNFFTEFVKASQKEVPHEFFHMMDFMHRCKEWDLKRLKSVGTEVIDTMMDNYYYDTIEFPVLHDHDGFRYIIVDIDGTIAHMEGHRGPFDEEKVLLDDPDNTVMNSIRAELAYDPLVKIIVMSGRHETCREDTEEWLRIHNFPYHYIFMRGADDNRGDDIVKYELYMKHVFGTGKRVVKVYDDRDRVVHMWRKLLGLKVYQVAPGNF